MTVAVRLMALLAIGVFASAADAQSVRGTVLQPDSTTRASGVIVIAADERGGVIARTLSGEAGDFDLRVPGAGTYTLRLLRVGFRPTTLAPVIVPADGIVDVRAVLGAEAVMLSTVTVKSENVCGTTEDAGRVIAQLWEQARTALTATELSVGSGAIDVDWQSFQFLMKPGSTQAQEQSVLQRRGATERPFVSASADSLARFGYVVEDGKDMVYRAPDANALLSDQFAATHCFRTEPVSAERAQWVGVAFRPSGARDRMRDIAGTLWLDRATTELRLLEFRYTNLPLEGDDPAVGGFVEFVRLSSGQWLVARWAIRTPHMVRRSVGGSGIPGGGRQNIVAIGAIGVTGGELLAARRGPVSLYEADRTTIATEGSARTAAAMPSTCGAAYRPGATLAGTVSNASRRSADALVTVTWQSGTPVRTTTLATVTGKRGDFSLPCIVRGSPLAVTATDGSGHAGPEAVPPLTNARTVIDIELSPRVPRRP